MSNTRRINLLSDAEIEDLYSRPRFNANEQNLYFALNKLELEFLEKYYSYKTRVSFILQLGYFKAKQQFYNFNFKDVDDDVKYITKAFKLGYNLKLSEYISEKYIRQQRKEILTLCNYKDWSAEYEAKITDYICELLRYYPKISGALRQLLDYFEKHQMVIPIYRNLQDMFTTAYAREEKRLSAIMLSIPQNIQQQLSNIIEKNDGITQLNIIKADQKNFQFTAVRGEIDKVLLISEVYEFSKIFIPKLQLARNAVRYYADLVEQYPPFRLRELNKAVQWLYSICFVHYRYQQLMDNLIISFMYHVRSVMEASKTYIGIAQMEYNAKMVVDFPKLAQFLDWFPNRDENLTHEQLNAEAYKILPKEQFPMLATFLAGNKFDKKAAKWEYYAKSARMLPLYLRPIIMAISLGFYKEDSKIMDLIGLLKHHYQNGKNAGSLKLADDLGLTIPKHMLPYLKRNPDDLYVDPHLFEFYVYEKIYHNLDRGKLFCNDSVSYCDIDIDLVDESMVDKAGEIANEFGYPKIPIYCGKRLDDALSALTDAWNTTTDNISNEDNLGIKFKETNNGEIDWSLSYDCSEELDDSFFRNLTKAPISDVIMFIGEHTKMWSGFEHMKDRYVKRKAPVELVINACVLSEAFGVGSEKMSEMSDINVDLLHATDEDFIRVGTLCAVNDIVNNYTNSLPIFKLWNLMEDKLMADADGQKFVTSNNNIQSRYSKKYLGKGRGISLYTLIANHVAVNAKTIGLNEYEGYSLFDMIYGNKTDVDIDLVTGDNHSMNQLNFIALDAVDVEYVPSIKNVRDAANNLYLPKLPENYTGILKPKGIIKDERIRSQERGIIRVLLSLIMQENTQTNIIRKLNSHARYARLKASIFEYNKIFKSTHVLNMIDNMRLRRAIRSARNRTESYHQLQSVIRKVYSGILKGKRIVDNRVSTHATRLVANCIIAYSATILNAVYEKMLRTGTPQAIIDEFARISPVAWIHIIFTGRYNFNKKSAGIDVQEMARMLEKTLRASFWRVR